MSEIGRDPRPATASSDRDRIAEEAARWFARLRHEKADPQLRAAFRQWRSENLAHRRAYAELEEIWRQLDGLMPVETGERLAAPPATSVRKVPWRRRMGRVAAVAAALVIGIAGYLQMTGEAPWLWEEVTTARGEQRTLMLEDGSTVYLNTATRLAVRMTKARRIVRLRKGEALFEVTHDPARPFLVEGSLGTVRVIGTRFDVALNPKRRAMRVLVVEGEVAVTPARADGHPRQPLALAPGELAEITDGHVAERRVADVRSLVSWREGYLIFDGSSLREVVDSVNRYLSHPLKIADAEIADLSVTAVIRLEDREAIVRALTTALPVKALRLDNGTTLLFADREQPPF